MADRWYTLAEPDAVATPALAVYPERVEANLRRMLDIAGGPDRVWPHVKTHKLAEIVALELRHGLRRFKCSTIAEAELLAASGAGAVMLALQPVGPHAARLARLAAAFPAVEWLTVVDDRAVAERLSAAAVASGVRLGVLVDLDTGMHRSGIAPGPEAAALYAHLAELPGLWPAGLHVYDGQCRERDRAERAAHVEADFAPVARLAGVLRAAGRDVPRIVCGGSPSFPVHARHPDRETSPGTFVFWDVNYGTKFPDLPFEPAALLLGRVLSKPGPGRLCLDLGYKAVSPDNPDLRVELLDVPEARVTNHSEEHLAVETPAAARFMVGDLVYGVPFHVCPTVALHQEVLVIRERRVAERWRVAARDRRLSF